MDSRASSWQLVKLRAFDLSDRTLRRGRASAIHRAERLRQRSLMIIESSVTAGIAWLLAGQLIHHRVPYFAPVAAILVLGATSGQRLSRGVEMAIGVTVGVALGDLWLILFGTGTWQIMLVVAIALSLATLLGAGPLIMSQAGVQSIAVTVLAPNFGYGFNRWADAVIGCLLALLVATVAPSGPLSRPAQAAAKVVSGMAEALAAAADALAAKDEQAASAVLDRAEAAEKDLAVFDAAAADGLEFIRHSLFQRRKLSTVTALAHFHLPLDRASRNLRVLVRRSVVAVWRDEEVPVAYQDLIRQLADACRFVARELAEGRLPTAARDELRRIGEASARQPLTQSISADVILAQIRSMVTDLLQLTGMDYSEARELIPGLD
jgi:uncharacterized membrane protein YgaE (UPF0421/DUF939 family)